MTIKIVTSSPQAEELAKNPEAVTDKRVRYPFDELELGTSFTLAAEGANLRSLRTIVGKKNKGLKKFVVIEHEADALIEVARIK